MLAGHNRAGLGAGPAGTGGAHIGESGGQIIGQHDWSRCVDHTGIGHREYPFSLVASLHVPFARDLGEADVDGGGDVPDAGSNYD